MIKAMIAEIQRHAIAIICRLICTNKGLKTAPEFSDFLNWKITKKTVTVITNRARIVFIIERAVVMK